MNNDFVLVAGRDTYAIRTTIEGDDLIGGLAVARNGADEWTFELPSWRSVGVGVGTGGAAYLWTARDLIILPEDRGAPVAVNCDEDVLLPFQVGDDWVLVCETSVRLVAGTVERARWDLADVVSHVGWTGEELVLHDDLGNRTHLRVTDEGIIAVR